MSVCARHHARLSCTLVNKTNKALRFKIREMHVLTEKNYRKPITCLCLVSESQDGCGFLRPLPGFLHISKSWLRSVKSCEMWMAKRNLEFCGGVTLLTVWPLGFRLSDGWSNVKKQNSKKFHWIKFKDLIGFIQQFENQRAFSLADRKELQVIVQNERYLWSEGSRNKLC